MNRIDENVNNDVLKAYIEQSSVDENAAYEDEMRAEADLCHECCSCCRTCTLSA